MATFPPVPPPHPVDAVAPGAAVTYYTVENFRPENSVGYLMRRIVGVVSQEVERDMEPLGLTDAQWKPLLRLYLREAGTVAELARCCEMDAGSMTRLLDRVEAKGLLRRVRSSEDRRVVNIELTTEGLAAAAQIPVILSRVQNNALRGFSETEWRSLQDFLQRLFTNVQATPVGSDTE